MATKGKHKTVKEFKATKIVSEVLVSPVITSELKLEKTSKWMSIADFKKSSVGSCFRPDIYLNNDRKCNKCPNTEFCSCYLNRGVAAKTREEEQEAMV